MSDLDKFMQRYKEARQIKCPHCADVIEDGEDMCSFISVHGEESDEETECSNCERKYYIKEHVDRTWDVSADPI
jgi:DNA-directed RNA polymerase subunit RPC12/RpoP